ncbi:MAG: alpha/beta hydrolase [Pirellulales bacterium]|nr:alpha/beta hydrolase [Pirellulales bacterium]
MGTNSRRIPISVPAPPTILVLLALAWCAGCVNPPAVTPAFPSGDLPLPNSPEKFDSNFCVVDANQSCRESKSFLPRQVSFRCVSKTRGRLQPSSLKSVVAKADSLHPVCILVHGYGVSRPRAVEDARVAIDRIHRASGGAVSHFVLFHWPSGLDHAIPWPMLAYDIRSKGKRADVAGHYLAWFISQLPEDQPVCLVGHSLGCRVAACALNLLGGGESALEGFKPVPRSTRPLNAVMMAAAMDRDWLCPGHRYGACTDVVDKLVILTNHEDSSLRWYPLVKRRYQMPLGRDGPTEAGQQLLQPLGDQLKFVSVTQELGTEHGFRNYMNSAQIADLIAAAIPDANPAPVRWAQKPAPPK